MRRRNWKKKADLNGGKKNANRYLVCWERVWIGKLLASGWQMQNMFTIISPFCNAANQMQMSLPESTNFV